MGQFENLFLNRLKRLSAVPSAGGQNIVTVKAAGYGKLCRFLESPEQGPCLMAVGIEHDPAAHGL